MKNLREKGHQELIQIRKEMSRAAVFGIGGSSDESDDPFGGGENEGDDQASKSIDDVSDPSHMGVSKKTSTPVRPSSAVPAEDGNDEEDLGKYNFKNPQDLKEIRELLRRKGCEVGVPFNTNILRIALNEMEEKIAMVIVSFYQVEMDKQMITRAIKTR